MQKLDVSQILKSYQSRLPLYTMRAICKKCDLPTSTGKEQIVKKLLGVHEEDEATIQSKIDESYQYFLQHLLYEDKAIKIFEKIPKNKFDSLYDKLSQMSEDHSGVASSFPYFEGPLNDSSIPFGELKLAYTQSDKHGLSLLFLSKRYSTAKYDLRDANHRADLGSEDVEFLEREDTQRFLSAYENVYAERRENEIHADVIFLDKSRQLIEFRVDISKRPPKRAVSNSFGLLNKKFEQITGGSRFVTTSFNFYDLVNTFYNSNEGRVAELGFTIDTDSIKHAKRRREDLRTELYHKEGVKAVGEIEPFRISILWDVDSLNQKPLELEIPGTFFHQKDLFPSVTQARLYKCVLSEEYFDIRDKIFEYADSQKSNFIDSPIHIERFSEIKERVIRDYGNDSQMSQVSLRLLAYVEEGFEKIKDISLSKAVKVAWRGYSQVTNEQASIVYNSLLYLFNERALDIGYNYLDEETGELHILEPEDVFRAERTGESLIHPRTGWEVKSWEENVIVYFKPNIKIEEASYD